MYRVLMNSENMKYSEIEKYNFFPIFAETMPENFCETIGKIIFFNTVSALS